MELNEITENIIGAAIEVHRTLGAGLLESVYEECLCYELASRGVGFHKNMLFRWNIKRLCLKQVISLTCLLKMQLLLS